MTRICWVHGADKARSYTTRLLNWWFTRHGGEIVDVASRPDYVTVSIADMMDLPVVRRARTVADNLGVPLIAGGFQSYTGSAWLAWADYLCVGEGYAFLRDLAKQGKAALDREEVLSRVDPDREVIPNYEIPWKDIPAIRCTKKRYNYLAGRGCHNKCRFCMTSWVQPHSCQTRTRIEKARRNCRDILLVTNDEALGSTAGSTTVRRFVESDRDDWPRFIRLGVEGVTESRRKWFSKPISDETLAAAIVKAGEVGSDLELFFIIGFDDDPLPDESFGGLLEHLPVDLRRTPCVHFKWTYFNPHPHTPLAHFDIASLREWDWNRATKHINERTFRARRFAPSPIGYAIWNACAHRCSAEQFAQWAKLFDRSRKMPGDDVRSAAGGMFGVAVVDGTGEYPWQRVRCKIR